jgi:uncharacterized membrane protein YtjA (UPF0391 family)
VSHACIRLWFYSYRDTIYFVVSPFGASFRSAAEFSSQIPGRKILLPLYGSLPLLSANSSQSLLIPDLKGGFAMLRWALIFFIVALLAAVLGFTGIAVAAAGVAKVLFFLFVVLFLITLLGHVARRP